jgi:hypothetical protein
MFHRASILLSVSLIIACPFWCAGDLSGAEMLSVQKPACSCCEGGSPGDDPGPDHQQPLSPGQDCQCGDCFCRGAVVDPIASPAAEIVACVDAAPVAVLTVSDAGGPELAKRSGRAWQPLPRGSSPTGRSARILHQSFLF